MAEKIFLIIFNAMVLALICFGIPIYAAFKIHLY